MCCPDEMSEESTTRDLILAVVRQRGFDRVAPFVLSLRQSGYRGRFVLFTSLVDAESIEKLGKNGATVVPFHFSGKRERQRLAYLWPIWRWYFATGASTASKMWLARRVFHLRYLRYLLYDEFLHQHGTEYDRVLLADCTDVYFQGDPFSWDLSPGVHFFMEEEKQQVGESQNQRLWMTYQFGREYVERHASKTVSCSGTTFGDTASIRKYIALMIFTSMRARNLGKIYGGDQGIHNYLLIERLLDNVIVHPNRHGPVMTMGVMRPGDWRTDGGRRVLNDTGDAPPVLHQYDRFPELKNNLVQSLPGRTAGSLPKGS
jgi:hypothetical protein